MALSRKMWGTVTVWKAEFGHPMSSYENHIPSLVTLSAHSFCNQQSEVSLALLPSESLLFSYCYWVWLCQAWEASFHRGKEDRCGLHNAQQITGLIDPNPTTIHLPRVRSSCCSKSYCTTVSQRAWGTFAPSHRWLERVNQFTAPVEGNFKDLCQWGIISPLKNSADM